MKLGPRIRQQKGVGSPRYYMHEVDKQTLVWLRRERSQANQVTLVTLTIR